MKPKSAPKPTSAKQLVANRRNATKSTGPRTAAGREVSRMNALNHGILSKQVLVRGHTYEEDGAELESLHGRFWDELQPIGPVEELLVDQIVTAHWRLRRALMAESGEIALSVDTGQRRRDRGTDPVMQWMKWTAFGDPIHAMEASAIGCNILEDWLGELRDDVEREGALTEGAVNKMALRFGDKKNSLVLQIDAFRRKTEAADIGKGQEKAEARAFLDRKMSEFRHQKEMHVDEDLQEEETRRAAAVLPSAEVLDKILRYETKLERQLYRAMPQLERIQRIRNGESVPAPLSVQISERG